MSYNVTSVQNSAHTTNASLSNYLPDLGYLDFVVIVLTVISFLIGAVSWRLIRKFRHIKNFVFLNALLSSILNDASVILYTMYTLYYPNFFAYSTYLWLKLIYQITAAFFGTATHCWLMVLGWILYVDIVKVFGGDVNRKFLKTSLFAWGTPFIISLSLPIILLPIILSKYIKMENIIYISSIVDKLEVFVPLTILICIYVVVLTSLLKKVLVNNTVVKSRCIFIATLIFLSMFFLIFIMGGIISMTMPPDYLIQISYVPLIHLQTIALNMYFLTLKSNRDLWRNFYVKRQKNNIIV